MNPLPSLNRNWITDLPEHILITIFLEWVSTVDLGYLDMAICQRQSRDIFISCIRGKKLQTVLINQELLDWMLARGLKAAKVIADRTVYEKFSSLTLPLQICKSIECIASYEVSLPSSLFEENQFPILRKFWSQGSALSCEHQNILVYGIALSSLESLDLRNGEWNDKLLINSHLPLRSQLVSIVPFQCLQTLYLSNFSISDTAIINCLESIPTLRNVYIHQPFYALNISSTILHEEIEDLESHLQLEVDSWHHPPLSPFENLQSLSLLRSQPSDDFEADLEAGMDYQEIPSGMSVLLGRIIARSPNLKHIGFGTGNYNPLNLRALSLYTTQLESLYFYIKTETNNRFFEVPTRSFRRCSLLGLEKCIRESLVQLKKLSIFQHMHSYDYYVKVGIFPFSLRREITQKLTTLELRNVIIGNGDLKQSLLYLVQFTRLTEFSWKGIRLDRTTLQLLQEFTSTVTENVSSSVTKLTLSFWTNHETIISLFLSVIFKLFSNVQTLDMSCDYFTSQHFADVLEWYGPRHLTHFSFSFSMQRFNWSHCHAFHWNTSLHLETLLAACTQLSYLKITGAIHYNLSVMEDVFLQGSSSLTLIELILKNDNLQEIRQNLLPQKLFNRAKGQIKMILKDVDIEENIIENVLLDGDDQVDDERSENESINQIDDEANDDESDDNSDNSDEF
jgi:hypothetical protein